MNGTSLLGATHLIAVRALRNNPMEVSLLVCDGYDPKDVLRRKNKEDLENRRSSTLSANMDTSSLSSEGENIASYTNIFGCLKFINAFHRHFCKLTYNRPQCNNNSVLVCYPILYLDHCTCVGLVHL